MNDMDDLGDMSESPKLTALSPEDAAYVKRRKDRLAKPLTRIIEELDARLVAAEAFNAAQIYEASKYRTALMKERMEKAEARVAELEAKFVKWAPIISGRCGRCGLHDGHHTISCGIRK